MYTNDSCHGLCFPIVNRSSQNNPPPSFNSQGRTVGQNSGNNFHGNTYSNPSPQTLLAGANDCVPRSRQNNDNEAVNYEGQSINSDNGSISQKILLESELFMMQNVDMGYAYSYVKYGVFITTRFDAMRICIQH